jgi:hypothetical protein
VVAVTTTMIPADPDDFDRRWPRDDTCSCCGKPAPPDRGGVPMHRDCARQIKETVARESRMELPPEVGLRRRWWPR